MTLISQNPVMKVFVEKRRGETSTMDLCFSMMTERGPNRVAREQGWAAARNKWEEERGALYLEQLHDAGKWAFSLAW